MEGPSPKKGFSGLKLSNSGSTESKENDCSAQRMQKTKKPITKHFMSPTISAASKVAVPRNKILAERNGIPAFSDTHFQKSPDLAPRKDISVHYSPKVVTSNSVALEANDVDDKSAMKNYDPSSCDPSPRPRYLRYNPNRRRELFLQFENEGGEESDSQNDLDEASSVDDEISPSMGGSDSLDSENFTSLGVVKKHDSEVEVEKNGEDEVVEEFEEEAERYEKDATHVAVNEKNCEDEVELDDEEVQEEFEEEEAELYEEVRGWSLKGIMKFLLVLSIFVLATSFIFSMDSSVLNSEDVTVSTKDGFNGNLEHMSKDAALSMLKNRYEIYMDVVNMDLEDAKPVEDSEEGMMESGHEQVEFVDMPVEWEDERHEQYSSDQINVATNATSANSEEGMMESGHEQVDFVDTPVEWEDERHEQYSSDQINVATNATSANSEEGMMESGHEQVDFVDTPVEWEDERHEQYSSDQLNVATNATSANSDHEDEMETEVEWVEWNEDQPLEDEWHTLSNQPIGFGNAESANSINGGEMETEVEHNLDLQPLEDECGQFSDQHIEADKAESETMFLQLKNKATGIGLIGALMSMISGSLFFMSRSKGGRKPSEGTPLVAKIMPIEKLVLPEEACPVTPKVEEKKIEKLVEPHATSSLLDFSEQAAKEFTKISAPTVQLLGELVVREVERSLRRCDRDQSIDLIESEDSNNIQERKKKAARFQISPATTPALEFSTTDSPSGYGSFTTEAKILKKENGRDAEFTTPVRRSSRIRNLVVTTSS